MYSRSVRFSRPSRVSRVLSTAAIAVLMTGVLTCSGDRTAERSDSAEDKASLTGPPTGPPGVDCANDSLAGYDGLLVIAPHPDDEVIGFSGLIDAYLEQGKPVEVVIATDGDAYCHACQFWKNGSTDGETCSALDFSNFETLEIDSFAEVRRSESVAALASLGAPPPTFLGYPDTGLGEAWSNLASLDMNARLRRSDFSSCKSCGGCGAGYGGGPQTNLTALSLMEALRQKVSSVSNNTLIATTHWLDGHQDHAGLGSFVRLLNDELEVSRPMALTVIHAHTPKERAHPDCWYPEPAAAICPCTDEARASADPTWLADLRRQRFQPDHPAALPDDAEYGDEVQLCLPERLFAGPTASKLVAIESFASQAGFATRAGSLAPELAGLMDCSGYLLSFVRSTEAFVLVESLAPVSSRTDPS